MFILVGIFLAFSYQLLGFSYFNHYYQYSFLFSIAEKRNKKG
tara:strand:+ start:52 stop:177 length:126 start_codon:yes stop_codon:yes gene_type:complete